MLKFLSGLGKDRINEDDAEVTTASIDDFDLEEFEIDVPVVTEQDQVHRTLFKTEVENLMNSVKSQAVEISCQFATFANWSAEIETLSARAATLQPLLTKLVEENSAQASALAEAARNKEANGIRVAELEAEVAHFRPLAARYEDELKVAKEKYGTAQSMLATLEGQFAQRLSENNELMYTLAKTESKAARSTEENMSLRQKALEHNAVIQNQMREIADLKSEISTTARALQRQEEMVADLSARLASAQETGTQSASTLAGVMMRDAQVEKDLHQRLADVDAEKQEMLLKLSNRDKQLSAAEVKIAGLNTKVEFLTQLTQKLRDDLRTNVDHSKLVEISNRHFADAASREVPHAGLNGATVDITKEMRPKLRKVMVSHAQ